jgi:hypothetical protein
MAILWAGIVTLTAASAAQAQQDVLAPAARYDVLKHQLNLAIRAKKPKQTVDIITQLRKTGLGVSGETLFYEAHAHYQLKNWPAAYRALVAYLNTMGRKGRNYKVGIGLYVEIERKFKQKDRMNTDVARADRIWSIASAAYDRVSKRRNAWKERVVTFGGSKDDMAWAMARRANGGFLVGGTIEQIANKTKKIKAGRYTGLLALSRGGRMAWNRVVIIKPAKDGAIRSLKALPKGGFLLGGIHRGFRIAARIDSNAVPIPNHDGKPWVSGYGRSKDGAGGVVSPAGKAGFIAFGAEIVAKDGKGPRLPFAVRLSKDGKALGKTVYTGNAGRFWHDIADAAALPGGDIVAVGETRPEEAWDTRPGMGYLLRIKPEGKLVWARRVPAQGKGDIRFSAVVPAHGGGVIAAGRQGGRLILFKAGADGQEQWRKIISHRDIMPAATRELCRVPQLASLVNAAQKQKNQPKPKPGHLAKVREMTCRSGTPFVSATAVSVRKNGYLVLASQGRGNRKKADIRLIAINNSGKILWDKVYGHDGFDLATSALETEDGGAIIAGTTNSIGAGGRDFLIFKVDRFGAFAPWTKLGPPAKPSAKPAKAKSVKLAPGVKSPKKAGAKPASTVKKDSSGKTAPPPEKAAPKKEAIKKEAKTKPAPVTKKDGDGETAKPAPKPKAAAWKNPDKAKPKPTTNPVPMAKKDGDGETVNSPEKEAPKKEAKTKPVSKPEPIEPTAKKDGDGEAVNSAPKPKAAAWTNPDKAKPKPEPIAKKDGDGETAKPAPKPAATQGENSPDTSFGDIFGSIFGSDDSKEPETKDKKSAPPTPDSAP